MVDSRPRSLSRSTFFTSHSTLNAILQILKDVCEGASCVSKHYAYLGQSWMEASLSSVTVVRRDGSFLLEIMGVESAEDKHGAFTKILCVGAESHGTI